jgi:hypothetical protein
VCTFSGNISLLLFLFLLHSFAPVTAAGLCLIIN